MDKPRFVQEEIEKFNQKTKRKKTINFIKQTLHIILLALAMLILLVVVNILGNPTAKKVTATRITPKTIITSISSSPTTAESGKLIKKLNSNKIPKTSRFTPRFQKEMWVTATAYTKDTCGKKPNHPTYGITRTGTKARYGVIAVDPKIIPLGTRVYVPGYGYARAEDTGGAIKGHRIDLCFENTKEAKKYGVKKIKIYILK